MTFEENMASATNWMLLCSLNSLPLDADITYLSNNVIWHQGKHFDKIWPTSKTWSAAKCTPCLLCIFWHKQIISYSIILHNNLQQFQATPLCTKSIWAKKFKSIHTLTNRYETFSYNFRFSITNKSKWLLVRIVVILVLF